VSDIAHLSGRTHLVLLAGSNLVDLDTERNRRASATRRGRRPARRVRLGVASPDPLRRPARGRDGPDAA
jgi:hypothetical protein